MTHLLQPLDLTTNASVKKIEKRGFSDYFTSTITEIFGKDQQRDIATIRQGRPELSGLPRRQEAFNPEANPCQATHTYEFLQGEKRRKIILKGCRAAGITEAGESARTSLRSKRFCGIFRLSIKTPRRLSQDGMHSILGPIHCIVTI